MKASSFDRLRLPPGADGELMDEVRRKGTELVVEMPVEACSVELF